MPHNVRYNVQFAGYSKRNGSPVSGLVAEMFEAMGISGIHHTTLLFSKIVRDAVIPSHWTKGVIINFYKGKG